MIERYMIIYTQEDRGREREIERNIFMISLFFVVLLWSKLFVFHSSKFTSLIFKQTKMSGLIMII